MMTPKFVERTDVLYRLLEIDIYGTWAIEYDIENPKAPEFFANVYGCECGLKATDGLRAIPAPDEYLKQIEKPLTQSQQGRLELIQPLLETNHFIRNKQDRNQLAEKIASENSTTSRRILRLYYRYLATGVLTVSKKRPIQENKVFDWAIRTFYFTAKKLSLKATYEMMLLQKFTDENGNLDAEGIIPSWSSFQHYFYANGYHKNPQKLIARDGLTNYQRNQKPIYGTASQWRSEIGSYQMDATIGDIYLVSANDRSRVIGRPNIVLAVDTATQLITGLYVGLESGDRAVMSCLANSAMDKVRYCKDFGIDIEKDQWPNTGVPTEIITDQGREFTGTRMDAFCKKFGVVCQTLPPFRPDRKGLVEKSFDLLQQRYKPILRGGGVIEADAQERWSVDYRTQAVLTLDEFTQVLIRCILYLNSGRITRDGRTPAELWEVAFSHQATKGHPLMEVDDQELYCMSLERVNSKMTRRGIGYKGLWYIPHEGGDIKIGDSCILAVDADNTSVAYIVVDGTEYHSCKLSDICSDYANISATETQIMKSEIRERNRIGQRKQIEASVQTTSSIRDILSMAKEVSIPIDSIDGEMIANQRLAERRNFDMRRNSDERRDFE